MNPLAPFFAWLEKRRRSRIAETEERRRAAIIKQIADRKAKHREFKPLLGELRRSTHRAIAAEIGRKGVM